MLAPAKNLAHLVPAVVFFIYLYFFQPNDGSELNEKCQHYVWSHTVKLLEDSSIKEATDRACAEELGDQLAKCNGAESALGCLLEHKDDLTSVPCKAFIQKIGYIAFSDYRLLPKLNGKCQEDIDKHKCGRLVSGSVKQCDFIFPSLNSDYFVCSCLRVKP
jgi:hypothetical protein